MKYYKQLDGLRAIAIIGVMIAHWYQNSITIDIFKNIPYGNGVTLFFVISGFLITKILLDFREKNNSDGKSQYNSIKSFYIRRSLRIFPIYYLTIFFLYFIGFSNTAELFPWLVTYSTNIYMTIHSKYVGSFTHFWSLAVEEQFYLFWVFIMVFVSRNYLKKTIIAFIIASILTLYYFKFFTPYWLAHSLVISHMYTLGLGALLAYYITYQPTIINKFRLSSIKGVLLILSTAFVLVYVYRKPDLLYDTFKDFKSLALSIIFFFVVLIALKDGYSGILKKILESRIMIYIGKISYGLYVYHLFMSPLFFTFINKYTKVQTSNFGYFVIFFVINMLLASVSWYVIEQPVNNLKRYFKY